MKKGADALNSPELGGRKVRCSQSTAAGKPCRAWAVRETDPPLCSAHAGRNRGAGAPRGNRNRYEHGFYSRTFTLEELADLAGVTAEPSLLDELNVVRIALRRVMDKMDDGIDIEDFLKTAGLIFVGANSAARLMRVEDARSGETDESIGAAIATALDELGDEWKLDL